MKRLLGGIAQHGESSFAKLLLFAALIQIDDDVGVHGIKIVNFAGNKKAEYPLQDTLHGRSGEIRTRGLLNPIQARYQAALHPD